MATRTGFLMITVSGFNDCRFSDQKVNKNALIPRKIHPHQKRPERCRRHHRLLADVRLGSVVSKRILLAPRICLIRTRNCRRLLMMMMIRATRKTRTNHGSNSKQFALLVMNGKLLWTVLQSQNTQMNGICRTTLARRYCPRSSR